MGLLVVKQSHSIGINNTQVIYGGSLVRKPGKTAAKRTAPGAPGRGTRAGHQGSAGFRAVCDYDFEARPGNNGRISKNEGK
jgi:hypothetical protein